MLKLSLTLCTFSITSLVASLFLTPIDIDTTQKICFMPKIRCYHCRDLNYLIWKYLVRINVRQLTVEQ